MGFRGVQVDGLHVRFGGVQAVTGVDLRVDRGQVAVLLGVAGAGKSTTLQVLAGVVAPSAGTAVVAGYDVRDSSPALRQHIGHCPGLVGLVPRLTPWEHLRLDAWRRDLVDWEERALTLLHRFGLEDVAHRPAAGLDEEQARRFGVVLAAHAEPAVLLLDEPFGQFDPVGADAALEAIEDARCRGAVVVVATRLRDRAAQTRGEVAVLRGGTRLATISSSFMAGADGARAYRALLA